MALLRSGCRTSLSSRSSSASFQSFDSKLGRANGIAENDDGFIITKRKRVRTALSTHESIEEVRCILPSLNTLIKSSDEDLKKILIENVEKVRCPSCNTRGTLSPIGKAGSAGHRRWKCGTQTTGPGCRMTCSQVVVFADALGAGSPKSWASVIPKGLAKRINLLEIKTAEQKTLKPVIVAQVEGIKEVRKGEVPTNLKDFFSEIEKELRPEIKSEKGVKLVSLLIRTVKAVLTSTDLVDQREPAVVQEQKVQSIGPIKIAKEAQEGKTSISYATVAKKNRPAWVRPTVKQLTRSRDPKEKQAEGLRALQWKPLKPINKRIVQLGQPLKEGPLKDKVNATKFIYVAGMTRQRYGVVRAALEAAGIEKKRIHDISFVGKQVGCLLTSTEYAETVERVLTAGNSTMKIIRDFDPLNNEHLKKPKVDGKDVKTPAQLYARRAAFAVSKSNSVFVAAKYQESISEEHYEYFKNELDRLVESRKKRQISPEVSKGRPKSIVKSNAMEVDSDKKDQPS